MTASFVTQCPHCRTSFRVSSTQLGAAHGQVRCGACLHVFNAAQQILDEHPLQPKAPAPAPSAPAKPLAAAVPPPAPAAKPAAPAAAIPTAGKATSETLWIHDDLDLDSLDEELAKLEQQELQLSQEFLSLAPAMTAKDDFLKGPDRIDDRHDEAWAEALLKKETAPKTSNDGIPAPAPSVAPPPPVFRPRPEPAAPAISEPLPADNEPKLGSGRIDDSEDDLEPAFKLSADRDHDHPAHDDDEDQHEHERDNFSAVKDLNKPGRAEPALRDDSLFHLADDPLQLDWQEQRKPWGRWIGWGLLNLIGAAALVTQYVAYHFDELARQDQYRPWFEELCPNIGCSLPSKVEISLIKSSNLVVRSHPDFNGALVVDAIIYNRATFAQPFPLLEIRFADLNGQLLASRRFKPSEYLAGELAGQAEMPPQTPIHISLDILDPGNKAVNYSLSFHSPE
ncbi:MAG: DUF3426 domain-containing protein [Pseudomonas sp.]|uniref:DUF3426 domain-containing protein n=1 Tax=Pseudomonas sp. TaxID=306 RepID=UPI0030F13FF6